MSNQGTFRLLRHADGREWSVRVSHQRAFDGAGLGVSVLLRFVVDGEVGERKIKKVKTVAEAETAAQQLIAEQLADGFIAAPASGQCIERLVSIWREEAPDFDTDGLRAQVLALPLELRDQLCTALVDLEEHHVAGGNGDMVVEHDPERTEAATKVIEGALPAALPFLLLALRHGEYCAAGHIDGILGRARLPASWPAILSLVIVSPEAQGPYYLRIPEYAFRQLGPPADTVLTQLVAMLDATNWVPVSIAAHLLSNHLDEAAIFAAMWSRRHDSHHIAIALQRAVPLRAQDGELRAFLLDFVNDPGKRWPGLDWERNKMKESIADLETAGKW